MTDERLMLFTDFRHIRCGDLSWHDSGEKDVPLFPIGLPEGPVIARAHSVARGIRLVAQPASKTEPFEHCPGVPRIVYDEGVYRTVSLEVIYPPERDLGSYSTEPPERVDIVYRESKDGFSWSQPHRCAMDVAGQAGQDGFTFFHDPKAPESERFKAVYTAHVPKPERERRWQDALKVTPLRRDTRLSPTRLWGIYTITSPDLKRWKQVHEPLMLHISDTGTAVEYDATLKRYVMYTRQMMHDRRWIARAEAEDFWHWDPITPAVAPGLDCPSDDLYLNSKTKYPGAADYHLMFPMVYHRDTQRSDIQMWSSADNMLWQRVPGGPVLSPGPSGAWDSEFIGMTRDLVPLGKDRVGIPYIGTRWPHKYPRWPQVLNAAQMAWACWPNHRLSAVVADGEGEFITLPVHPAGRTVHVNVRTGLGGWVRIGIEGKAGRAADDCPPIVGDHAAHPVSWNGTTDIAANADEPIVLRVRLRCAELFSIQFV